MKSLARLLQLTCGTVTPGCARFRVAGLLFILTLLPACNSTPPPHSSASHADPHHGVDAAQIPGWSHGDLDFLLRGSMSGEFIPEKSFRALVRANPDLFPKGVASFGFLTDAGEDLPIGLGRREVPHLGGEVSIGLNCAACHVGEARFDGGPTVRVAGMTSPFDPEAFYGATLTAMARASQPDGMKRYLAGYLAECDPSADIATRQLFNAEWDRQHNAIVAGIADAGTMSRHLPAGLMSPIDPDAMRLTSGRLQQGVDLAAVVREHLKLFHNIGVALHLPPKPPSKLPPPSGPGRNTAFGLLSAVLFNEPTPHAPTKFSPVWNADQRAWVHWDGNTSSPIGRNILASLGLGAPLDGHRAIMDYGLVDRQTQLSETIRPPQYPMPMDEDAAARGARIYQANCAKCHDIEAGYEDQRLHDVAKVGTDPARAKLFTPKQAELYNDFFAKLELDGYTPPREPTVRSTGKYMAPDLAGVWARAPYLHNGSVRTMRELLTPPGERPKSHRRGTTRYDEANMGFKNEGAYVFDTTSPGNSNAGHDYGTRLSDRQKRDLIEYLRTK